MCLGVPGRIDSIRDDRGTPMATVDFGGIRKEVCLAYLPDAEVGEYTLVHVGFAITRIDEESAMETLELIRAIGNLAEELGEEPAHPSAEPDAGAAVGTRSVPTTGEGET
jgi:hydrogenase expression/formation protein HypC